MHTAYEYRGKGIGKILFEKAISSARELQAEKLYITASSSLGTQNFYKAMGCIYAEEIVPELFEEEPKDVHMEYTLEK